MLGMRRAWSVERVSTNAARPAGLARHRATGRRAQEASSWPEAWTSSHAVRVVVRARRERDPCAACRCVVGDLRASQAFGIALGVLTLWVTISEGAGWTAIVGALGRLVLFLMAAWSLYAVTAVRAFSKQEVVGSSLK